MTTERPDRPFILVTNDDGIEADGIWYLAEALLEVGDVMICAPAFQQSGTGTSFTFNRDLQSERAQSRVEAIDAYQVDGTPGDAVTVGLRQYAKPRRVHMIVAGLNPGANLGRDAIHSGTVGGAMQGHHRGLPSLAVSLASMEFDHMPAAAAVGARIAGRLWDSGNAAFLNVNIPNRPLSELNDLQVTRMAQTSVQSLIEEVDESGRITRRLVHRDDFRVQEGTDAWAVRNGIISVTPIHTDLTAHHVLDSTLALFSEGFSLPSA
jgi:5'-nucleotidase